MLIIEEGKPGAKIYDKAKLLQGLNTVKRQAPETGKKPKKKRVPRKDQEKEARRWKERKR